MSSDVNDNFWLHLCLKKKSYISLKFGNSEPEENLSYNKVIVKKLDLWYSRRVINLKINFQKDIAYIKVKLIMVLLTETSRGLTTVGYTFSVDSLM